jgi:hypothetical protein
MDAAIGNLIGIVAFALVGAAVLKLFQISATLVEIKELLSTNRLRQEFAGLEHAPAVDATRSGEEMMRALDRELHLDEQNLDEQTHAIDPEIVEPR